MPRPMLDGVELEQVQRVEAEDEEVLGQHGVPALEGDFLQDLGRRVTRLTLTGVITGADSSDQLKTLREKFRLATPVPFVEDIAIATKVDKVLIEEFGIRELAGRPNRFEFEMTLREFLPPPRPEQEEPPPPPPPPPTPVPEVETATLEVEVIVEGDPNFDFSKVTVTAVKLNEDGSRPSQTLTNRAANVWTEERMAIGGYTISAVVSDPPPMSGSTAATLRAGQITRAQIILRQGPIIATQFVTHFRFDNAFLEPCMREVVQQVTRHATDNSEQKLLMVGNTDEVGSPSDLTASDPYNQSLSERRARSAFAYARSSVESATSNTEWNALRRGQAGLPTLGDKWGPRQYQYMLQALGFYPGVIDGDHGPLTSDSVRSFREAKGLPPGTTVDDPVWEALIADYLAQDNTASPAQFLPNTDPATGCDGGILKWLGVATQDPVRNIRAAHRPNRRVEFLFVNTDRLPCPEPQPDTFNLPSPGAVSPTWCLGPGNPRDRTCFVVKHLAPAGTQPRPNQWVRQPAEPGTVTVRGRIVFEDGSPAGNVRFILIAPDGEFMDGERSNGEGNSHRTAADGTFSYPNQKGVGIYTMEIQDPLIARLEGENQSTARGTVVCKRMDGSSDFNVVVRDVNTIVNPLINASAAVVVRKSYTNPARQRVTLTTDGPFFRSGTFTVVGTAIRFFDADVNGNQITFNGTDNVFTGARLTAGVDLFADSITPSAVLDDVVLTLTLTPGVTPVGPPATATMTAVELTLDVALTRTAPGVDPPLMPQPPAVVPAPATDKVNLGRFVQVQDPNFSHERAMLIIQQTNPATFAGTLLLTPINAAQLQAFTDEVPASGQVPVAPMPFPIPGPVPPGGTRLFIEGLGVSAAVRDNGFQLGIQNVEPEGDKVAMTTVQIEMMIPNAAGTLAPSTFARFGLWDNAIDPATGNLRIGATDATHFIGSDTRRLAFRLRDPSAGPTPQVEWRTVNANGTDDHAPAGQPLPLSEQPANSHIFLSNPALLVTDNPDRDLTGSGLTAPQIALLSPRIRKATVDATHQLDGRLAATYTPAPSQILRIAGELFQRSPEERRRVRVHLVSVRTAVGGGGVLQVARRNAVTDFFHSIYARCGIFAEVDEILIDPPASCLAWPTIYTNPVNQLFLAGPVVEGFTFSGGVLNTSTSQSDIITVVRNLATFDANDIYIVLINRIIKPPLPPPPVAVPAPAVNFTSGGGQAFPDSWTAAGALSRGFAFVSVLDTNNLAEPHEATHITTDLFNNAGGHFDLGNPSPAGGPGNIDGLNLMQRHPLILNGNIRDSKRLWNTQFTNTNYTPSLVLPPQIDAIRRVRFIRNF